MINKINTIVLHRVLVSVALAIVRRAAPATLSAQPVGRAPAIVPPEDGRTPQQLEASCNSNNAADCGRLGFLKFDGRGVPQDQAAAAVLFQQACDGADASGCFGLAFSYAEGHGVPVDERQAVTAANLACNGGNLAGCAMLGVAYEKGAGGIVKNEAFAAQLYRRACEGGLSDVCDRLTRLTGQPANTVPSNVLPPDFRGRVVYSGRYTLTERTAARPPRRLSVEEVLRSATSARSVDSEGTVEATMEFNGPNVTGRYHDSSGASGQFTGTRTGDTCNLVENDFSWTARCGLDGYSQDFQAPRGTRSGRIRSSVRAPATQVIDYAEQERQREAELAAQRAAIEALPRASVAWARQLETHVATDSQGWVFNRYDAGSIGNVRIASGSVRSGNFVLRGEYTYNGGAAGWVLAQYADGRFECIQFWDAQIGCRTLRTPEYATAARAGLIGALTGAGNSGGSSQTCNSSCEDERWYAWRAQQQADARSEGRPDPY